MKNKTTEVCYEQLPADSSSQMPCRTRLQRCISKCTPLKVIVLIILTALSTCMIIYSCLDKKLLERLCCSKYPVITADKKPTSMTNQKDIIPDISVKMKQHRMYSYREGNDNIRYKHTKRRLPQCIIIGVRKGGTRALLNFLNIHPVIQIATKEIHFFDDDDNYGMGYEWYRKKMPYSFPNQITVEKTPAYFVEDNVPERVYQMNSSMKLILIVRDPTERAISDYTQIHMNKVMKGKEHETFEELAIDQDTGDIRTTYKAIRRSIYHRHLERWLQYFPLEQFLILTTESLIRDPVSQLKKVESFLGIEHKISSANFYYNRTKGFFCMRNETHEKCLAESKGRPHPDVEPEVIKKLQDFYRPHNYKFYRLVGHEFGWP